MTKLASHTIASLAALMLSAASIGTVIAVPTPVAVTASVPALA